MGAPCPVGGCPEVVTEADLRVDKEVEKLVSRALRKRNHRQWIFACFFLLLDTCWIGNYRCTLKIRTKFATCGMKLFGVLATTYCGRGSLIGGVLCRGGQHTWLHDAQIQEESTVWVLRSYFCSLSRSECYCQWLDTLTKAKRKGKDGKTALVSAVGPQRFACMKHHSQYLVGGTKVRDCCDRFAELFVFGVEDVRSNKLKDLRLEWRHSRCVLHRTFIRKYRNPSSPTPSLLKGYSLVTDAFYKLP